MDTEIMDDGERQAWYALTPAERFAESMKLWEVFLTLGGSLEPEPDTQSPFYALYFEDPGAADGGSSVHSVRGSGVQPRYRSGDSGIGGEEDREGEKDRQ